MCMIYMGDLLHWFSSVTLSWLEPSLSFEISVHDSRSYSSPALNKAWCVFLNQAIGGSSESSCSFVSGGCWQVLAEWEVGWCQGEPCLCGSAPCEQQGAEWSHWEVPELLHLPACVHGALSFLCCLCHCGVYFLERVPSATVCVHLPKTHLHIIQLCHFVWIFSCVDVLEEIHWNKGFATYCSCLRGAAYLCDHCLSLSQPLCPLGVAGNDIDSPRHVLT